MTPFSRPRFGRALALFGLSGATVAAVIGVALPSSGAASARIVPRGSVPSAKQLITETQKSMSGQSSVRLTITSTDKATKQSETVTEDAGKSNGLESIVFGTASANVRFTASAAYVSGNALGLEKIVGLSTKGAKSVGDKWIVVQKGSSQFSNIVNGGTIGPLTKALLPTSSKSVNVRSDKLNGRDVFAMTWTQTSSSSTSTAKVDLELDIATTGATLPIELTASQGAFKSVTQFAHWNEHINVIVPKSTIAYSKVPT
jgi:hypothetical protein